MYKLLPFLLSLTSRYWSLVGTHEHVSCLNANSHHTSHVVYGFVENRMLALVTFKTQKTREDVKKLYGDVEADPQPIYNRVKMNRVDFHKAFMKANFANIVEIN